MEVRLGGARGLAGNRRIFVSEQENYSKLPIQGYRTRYTFYDYLKFSTYIRSLPGAWCEPWNSRRIQGDRAVNRLSLCFMHIGGDEGMVPVPALS